MLHISSARRSRHPLKVASRRVSENCGRCPPTNAAHSHRNRSEDEASANCRSRLSSTSFMSGGIHNLPKNQSACTDCASRPIVHIVRNLQLLRRACYRENAKFGAPRYDRPRTRRHSARLSTRSLPMPKKDPSTVPSKRWMRWSSTCRAAKAAKEPAEREERQFVAMKALYARERRLAFLFQDRRRHIPSN